MASPAGERDGPCPYIRAGLNQDPTPLPNVANIEGNRIYRTVVLTRLRPAGCRFYFANPPHQATADIVPSTFASAAAAHDQMVRIAAAGRSVDGKPGFAPGVDGILFQTRFFGPDGNHDWAFVFAKGTTVVVVHTEESTNSYSAVQLARAIVDRF